VNTSEQALSNGAAGSKLRSQKPVLLVDSDFSSTVLISRIFRELGLLDDLVISVDCENALMRLNQPGQVKPTVILLDLKMPRMSALSFLKLLKEDERFQTIPVVILAESSCPDEVSACYGIGAAGYVIRSKDYGELRDKLKSVCAYWRLSRLPKL